MVVCQGVSLSSIAMFSGIIKQTVHEADQSERR